MGELSYGKSHYINMINKKSLAMVLKQTGFYFMIKIKYGNNVSNALIYAFLSGGYPALICIVSIYFYFSYLAINIFFREKII